MLYSVLTGWTNVNLLYFPDSKEIASPEGLTLWCSEIGQSKRPLKNRDLSDFKAMTFNCVADIAFF